MTAPIDRRFSFGAGGMPRPDDLSGMITIRVAEHADFFIRNAACVMAEHRMLGFPMYSAWQVVARPLLDDEFVMRSVVDELVWYGLRPWSRPDRDPFPVLTVSRLGAWIDRVVARGRGEYVVRVGRRTSRFRGRVWPFGSSS